MISHAQGELVDRLLQDLATLPRGTVRQVIVTINRPDDRWVPSGVERLKGLLVLRNTAPLGFGANHNRAFQHCTEPFFSIVNPDIRVGADPFGPLIETLVRDEACVLAVPVQASPRGERETFARPVPTPWNVAARRLFPRRQRTRVAEVHPHWVAGAFMLWRSRCYGELGGFDERYYLYCEDVDICLRLQLSGRRFAVVETARVVHEARRGSTRSLRYTAWHVTSLLRLWLSPVFWRFVLKAQARSH